jgi:K+-transporting ATPase ATPase A chain
MTANGWFQIGLYLLVIFLVTKPVGVFMTKVFNREKTFLDPVLRPIEKLVYRLTGVDEQREMRWTEYTISMLLFSGVSMILLYLIERTQRWLPFNPQKFPNVEPGLAFGTAASFTTNTNWQVYSGESTVSYLTQMAGLAYHNFASAAVGIVSPSWSFGASPGRKPISWATSGSTPRVVSSGFCSPFARWVRSFLFRRVSCRT